MFVSTWILPGADFNGHMDAAEMGAALLGLSILRALYSCFFSMETGALVLICCPEKHMKTEAAAESFSLQLCTHRGGQSINISLRLLLLS